MLKIICALSLSSMLFFIQTNAQTCSVSAGTFSVNLAASFCSGDGKADLVTFSVTGAIGDNYRFLYCDAFGTIKIIDQNNIRDFEGSSSTTVLMYVISYNNGLQGLAIGNKISNLNGCYDLKATGKAVTVFNKEAGSISSNGSVAITVCVDDKTADNIPITFDGFDAFGTIWATTDLNDNIHSLNTSVPNFEGTGGGVVISGSTATDAESIWCAGVAGSGAVY